MIDDPNSVQLVSHNSRGCGSQSPCRTAIWKCHRQLKSVDTSRSYVHGEVVGLAGLEGIGEIVQAQGADLVKGAAGGGVAPRHKTRTAKN